MMDHMTYKPDRFDTTPDGIDLFIRHIRGMCMCLRICDGFGPTCPSAAHAIKLLRRLQMHETKEPNQ